jgi:hypothetical protein
MPLCHADYDNLGCPLVDPNADIAGYGVSLAYKIVSDYTLIRLQGLNCFHV